MNPFIKIFPNSRVDEIMYGETMHYRIFPGCLVKVRQVSAMAKLCGDGPLVQKKTGEFYEDATIKIEKNAYYIPVACVKEAVCP